MAAISVTPEDLVRVREVIAIAETAQSRGNRPFGALLVSADNEVLGAAGNTQFEEAQVLAHAEMNLLRQAVQDYDSETLAGATLYTSAEPCAMCCGAIFWSRVSRLVFALSTQRLHEITRASERMLKVTSPDVLHRGGRTIEILGPVLEEEAERLFSSNHSPGENHV